MTVANTCYIGIFGLLFYVTNTADCRNADPELKKTIPDSEQNVGKTCFASVPFVCNPSYEYRELNGGCTCLEVPSRGMAGSTLTRLLQADYQDNKKVIKLQTNGEEFKSARVLSNVFCTNLKEGDPNNLDKVFTLSMTQWAQCLTHDVVGTGGKLDFDRFWMIERLKLHYASHTDVELFLGGILEADSPGSQVGPTFQSLIAEQFCRLQIGDRFYFEAENQPLPFTELQLEQIRKTTLSLLYCITCPKLGTMQPDAFRLYSEENNPIPCTDITDQFTLEPWREEGPQ